ncbi:MAG: ABC transporter ATP-binding protein [Selenomonadaceae bacterium]|nr:ABC transporter ATP-binding protein [Selenomonadaceae bacterium]
MQLTVENVGFKIGEKEILRNINYSFAEGKRTSIIGANGAGKSTLLKIICLLNENFSGRVTLDGDDMKKFSRKKIAKIMAVLPQEKSAPQDTTVRQLTFFGRFPHRNFFGGDSKKDSEAVELALKITRMKELEDRQISSLSGGEKQRAWLAMTLAQNPKILLLDEPTTYLDIAHQIEVMEIVENLNKNFGTTVIMVLHDINHVRFYSDEVIAVKDHEIFAAGSPEKILTANSVGKIFDVRAETFTNDDGRKIIFPVAVK